jgi:hypothetical protein
MSAPFTLGTMHSREGPVRSDCVYYDSIRLVVNECPHTNIQTHGLVSSGDVLVQVVSSNY